MMLRHWAGGIHFARLELCLILMSRKAPRFKGDPERCVRDHAKVNRMAIYRLIQNSTFQPQEISEMTEPYERALANLGIVDRTDPQTESIAFAILHLLREGETDPDRLAEFACRAFGQKLTRPEQQAST
jgi:hypothetical protein